MRGYLFTFEIGVSKILDCQYDPQSPHISTPISLGGHQANVQEGNCQSMSLLERPSAVPVALVMMKMTLVVIIGSSCRNGDSHRGSDSHAKGGRGRFDQPWHGWWFYD